MHVFVPEKDNIFYYGVESELLQFFPDGRWKVFLKFLLLVHIWVILILVLQKPLNSDRNLRRKIDSQREPLQRA